VLAFGVTVHIASYHMKFNLSNFLKYAVLVSISVIAFISLFFVPAIPQDPSYHLFADQRKILGISHFFNICSNALFLFVGFLGIKLLLSKKHDIIVADIYWAYLTFFIGVFAVGIGSGYYHLFPSNNTLIWDRLPMTIAFMAFFSIILSEFISVKLGKKIFIPLLLLGIFSVGYWFYTEQQGKGDLRMYGLVQFLPILLIPLILIMFPSRFKDTRYYWYLLGFYVLAKIFEASDEPVYGFLSVISGHSIKHLCAGIGCYFFYIQLKNRASSHR
jgi:hypothetical protein